MTDLSLTYFFYNRQAAFGAKEYYVIQVLKQQTQVRLFFVNNFNFSSLK